MRMDPRHRQILEALKSLREGGKTPATPIDVALKLGLKSPEDMGGFFSETIHMGWVAPVNRDFQGRNLDFDLTESGEQDLAAAAQQAAPMVVLDDIRAQVDHFLSRWAALDNPFYPHDFRQALGLAALSDDEVILLLRQLEARGQVTPHHDGGWYPVEGSR